MNWSNNYNGVAGIYNFLVRLVFGSKLINSTLRLLHLIPKHATVLVVGGGTGNFVKALATQQPTCTIHYLDISIAMLRQAKKNNHNSDKIKYIQADAFCYNAYEQYDWVVFNFFLDMFPSEELRNFVVQFKNKATPGTNLYITDFKRPISLRQKILVCAMILFFKLSTGLKIKKIEDIRKVLKKEGVQLNEDCTVEDSMFFCSIMKV